MRNLHQSRSILIQMLLAALLLGGLGAYFSDTLAMIYLSGQQTALGYMLNGMILILFLLGIGRAVALLLSYQREEQALSRLLHNLNLGAGELLEGVAPASIIALRVELLEQMRDTHAQITHQALAATLLAAQSTRTGLIRFIHNILILCGVLGTIVSLSIALFGASSLLESAVSSTGMGMVIHGMSTALSTTMTAIVCYLFLAYFLSAIQNLQTHLLGRIEELTATRLLPRYQISEEAVSAHALDLVREAHLLVQSLHEQVSALDMPALRDELAQQREQAELRHAAILAELRTISAALKDGFRLPQ